MCTIISPEDTSYVLDHDIIVYKIATLDDNNNIRSFFFNKQDTIDLGKLLTTEITYSMPMFSCNCRPFSVEEIQAVNNITVVEIHQGFHSFKCLEECVKQAKILYDNFHHCSTIIVCECTVPKGSEVVNGYLNNLVSNQIIYNKTTDYVYYCYTRDLTI